MIALLNWKIGEGCMAMSRGRRSISGSRPTQTSELLRSQLAFKLVDEGAHATRALSFNVRFFRCTSRSEMAAGVTPGTRLACPTVAGRASPSFWRTSWDKPGNLEVVEVFGQARLFVALLALDLILLALDVARVLGADFDLHADLGGQAVVHAATNPAGPAISSRSS